MSSGNHQRLRSVYDVYFLMLIIQAIVNVMILSSTL